MKKNLLAIYLRVDSSSRSLTKRALSQLILKIIYSFNRPVSEAEISTDLQSILGTKLSPEKINSAFEILITDGKVGTEVNGNYTITAAKRNTIDIAFQEFENRQKRIIEKYFGPISTPEGSVKQWFEEVTIEFFNEYSSEWIAELCLNAPGVAKAKQKSIQGILDSITAGSKLVLEKDKDWLKKQYFKFLQSSDADVSAILWDYGTSRFSATLITANTSADLLSIEEFTNSKSILDTNVLMYLDLEKGRYAESFESMEKIFTDLKISPVYFFSTRDEFTRTMEHKKDDVIRAVENYSMDVIEASSDPFLQTALHRGCKRPEDFADFFIQLMDVPNLISESLKIEIADDPELDTAITNGQNNLLLKEKINNAYKRKTDKNKRKNALLHDAGLISGAEFMRKREKCFILSRDSTINEVALENPLKNEMPIAIGLDTLINLLAIDNGGTDIDPTNCAPLFASIIKLALMPEKEIFKPEDLVRMLEIEMQIGQLPSEEIIDIAREFHHNTIIGAGEEETSLQLTRRFQKAKLELQSDLDKAKQDAHFQKEEKEKHIKRTDKLSEKLKAQYTGELRDQYDRELRRNRVLIFVILPVATILITLWGINTGNKKLETPWAQDLLGVALNIAAWALTDYLYLDKRIFSKYSERVNHINNIVEARIRDEMAE